MALKTVQDLDRMKERPIAVFSDAYNYYLRDLEKAILKGGGRGREFALSELEGFDEPAQAMILSDLAKRGAYLEKKPRG